MDKLLILKRIKEEKNFKTDTELANFLGVSKAVLSNWYKRDSIDYDLVLSKCELMDLNYIIRGEKLEYQDHKAPDTQSMSFIMDRYEALISKNTILTRENEELKLSRGKSINTILYNDDKKKVGTSIAAEPSNKH